MAKPDNYVCTCGSVHRVAIFRQGCTYKVEPGRLVVHPGALVTLVPMVNTRDDATPIRAWVPEGLKAGSRNQFEVKGPTPLPFGLATGVFPYSVYVPGDIGPDFAEGGSAPRIIVADP
jgi:hypothetical protein